MRAHRPEVDLLVLDEPVSSVGRSFADTIAQTMLFTDLVSGRPRPK